MMSMGKHKRKRNRKKGLKVQSRIVTTKAIKVAKPVNPHKHNQTLLPLNLKKVEGSVSGGRG